MAKEEWNDEVMGRLAEALQEIYIEIKKLGKTNIKQNQTKRVYLLKD